MFSLRIELLGKTVDLSGMACMGPWVDNGLSSFALFCPVSRPWNDVVLRIYTRWARKIGSVDFHYEAVAAPYTTVLLVCVMSLSFGWGGGWAALCWRYTSFHLDCRNLL